MGKFSPVDHYLGLFQYYWMMYQADKVSGSNYMQHSFQQAMLARKYIVQHMKPAKPITTKPFEESALYRRLNNV